MGKALTFNILLIFSLSAQAQNTDSLFIEVLSDMLSLKANINNEVDGFDLKTGNTEYQIYPNTSLLNSYTFSYGF